MNTLKGLIRRWATSWLATKLAFAPILLFVAYATGGGVPPDTQRWAEAFLLGGALAALQVAIALSRGETAHRLMLACNLYLFAGGAIVAAGAGRAFYLFFVMKGSAVLLAIVAVGLVTTWRARGGFIGRPQGTARRVSLLSWLLLALTGAALLWSLFHRDDVSLGASVPIMVVSAAYKLFGWLADRPQPLAATRMLPMALPLVLARPLSFSGRTA